VRGRRTRGRTGSVIERDDLTVRLYATLALVGFLLNGLGSVLAPLQDDLGTTRAQVAFYPSLFAAALVAVGIGGAPFVRRLGDRRGLLLALAGLGAGAALLAVPSRPVTLLGAVVLGVFAALAIQLVPAGLSSRHPVHATAAIGEANAASSIASLVAPALVALALVTGLTWRLGYSAPAVLVAVLLLVRGVRGRAVDTTAPTAAGSETGIGLEAGRVLPRWTAVFLAVSVEFCLVFWAASAFHDWHGAGRGAAAALAGTFLLGMAVARVFAARLSGGRHPTTVVLGGSAVTTAGFAVFWSSPLTWLAAVGLFVTGTGVALMYPATVSRLVAAWPHNRNAAAGLGALASGAAIGIPPFVLAGLADHVGIRAAYLLVPGLVLLLVLLVLVTARPSRRGQPADTSTTPASAATTPTC
jgi:MFS family permease